MNLEQILRISLILPNQCVRAFSLQESGAIMTCIDAGGTPVTIADALILFGFFKTMYANEAARFRGEIASRDRIIREQDSTICNARDEMFEKKKIIRDLKRKIRDKKRRPAGQNRK